MTGRTMPWPILALGILLVAYALLPDDFQKVLVAKAFAGGVTLIVVSLVVLAFSRKRNEDKPVEKSE